ncbi:MAG: MFS transporter [Oscillospiraceae bacterium]|nr:MFS transporter [Oscillospiraceae bacterium]
MRAINIKTEYLSEPIGLGIDKPRFYWNCSGDVKQTAYQIVCKSDDEVIWDSGKVLSDSMSHVQYEGKQLKSRQHVDVEIKLWNEKDHEGEVSTSSFEMGLLQKEDWRADWISGDYEPVKNVRYPVDHFRKVFQCTKAVKKARLYVTACGIYEAKINGKVVSFPFAPGSTDYRKRIQVQTYDVTDTLSRDNVLELELADGWYRGSDGAWGITNVFGRATGILAQLEIVAVDGTAMVIATDRNFDWSNDGPVRFNDLKDGEIYDASMTPSYRGKAKVIEKDVNLTISNNVGTKKAESFDGKLFRTPSGKKVYDFSQNLAGTISFKVHGRKGQRVHLLLGEKLDENGEFTQANIQLKRPVGEMNKILEMQVITYLWKAKDSNYCVTPKQEVVFYCSGGEDLYEMKYAKSVILIGCSVTFAGYYIMSISNTTFAFLLAKVVDGFGYGMLGNTLLFLIINQWFPGESGTASSIMMCFSGIAGTVFSPLLARCITRIGWRKSFLVPGALCVVLCLPFLLIKERLYSSYNDEGTGTTTIVNERSYPKADRKSLPFMCICLIGGLSFLNTVMERI